MLLKDAILFFKKTFALFVYIESTLEMCGDAEAVKLDINTVKENTYNMSEFEVH